MYREVLFAVKFQDGVTDFFNSKIGVKQGCISSPTLFSLYINDLSTLFDATCDPVNLNDTRLSCLLYADDLVLISQSGVGLQSCLDKLSDYCDLWNLTVNINKTKVMIFNKAGRKITNDIFIFKESQIEHCMECKYLGILFKPLGIFTSAINLLCKKASKAMFCIRKLLYSHNLNVYPHLKLFDSCVRPILLYCSEIRLLILVRMIKVLNLNTCLCYL